MQVTIHQENGGFASLSFATVISEMHELCRLELARITSSAKTKVIHHKDSGELVIHHTDTASAHVQVQHLKHILLPL